MASIGVCSRREADKAIEAGRVMINGQVVELGATVGDEDFVSFDGRYIGMGKDVEKIKPIIIAFNKPEGLVCTTSDNDGAMNVVDYIGMKERIYPVCHFIYKGIIYILIYFYYIFFFVIVCSS